MIPAFFLANRRGIARIESTGLSVTTTEVTYNFRDHEFMRIPFAELFIVRLNQAIPTSTTGTLPVKFGSYQVKGYNNANLTVADLRGTGIYIAYFDSASGYLQLVASFATPTT